MKIGILGSGAVGSALGTEWEKKGHSVIYGVRDPHGQHVEEFKKKRPGVVLKSIDDAIDQSDVILLAIPHKVAKQIIAQSPKLSQKIIIDCTNPFAFEKVKKVIIEEIFNPNKVTKDSTELTPAPFHLEVDNGSSGAEELAKLLKNAKIVKAFNSTGATNMINNSYPNYNGLKPVMYICGNDKQAIQIAYQLAEELGLEPIILGDLSYARYLESLAVLWLHSSIKIGNLDSAFGLMRR